MKYYVTAGNGRKAEIANLPRDPGTKCNLYYVINPAIRGVDGVIALTGGIGCCIMFNKVTKTGQIFIVWRRY